MDTSLTLIQTGFCRFDNVISQDLLHPALSALDANADNHSSTYRRRKRSYAWRRVAESIPEVLPIMQHPKIHDLAYNLLSPKAKLVRVILFDKIPEANWYLKWHQDRMIAVQQRMDVEGFSSWSVKENIPHVQPPTVVLEHMLSLRLHLDDCNDDNGPMIVIPGSHAQGKIQEEDIATLIQSATPVSCTGQVGSVIAFRPLLLHASRRALRPLHRRILHLEFSDCHLPQPLQWYDPLAAGEMRS